MTNPQGASVGVIGAGAWGTALAQALASDPAVLLCDEPLLSLDVRRQQEVTALIDATRHATGTAVLFVTHEVNPVLPYTDRVLYLGPAGHAVGAPDVVLTSERLSALFGASIEVVRAQGRVFIVGDDGHVHHVEEEDA